MNEGLGRRIRQARKEKNWSQKRLAEELGLNAPTPVNRWEAGTFTPNDDSMTKLAQCLGKSVDWLRWGQSRHPSGIELSEDSQLDHALPEERAITQLSLSMGDEWRKGLNPTELTIATRLLNCLGAATNQYASGAHELIRNSRLTPTPTAFTLEDMHRFFNLAEHVENLPLLRLEISLMTWMDAKLTSALHRLAAMEEEVRAMARPAARRHRPFGSPASNRRKRGL